MWKREEERRGGGAVRKMREKEKTENVREEKRKYKMDERNNMIVPFEQCGSSPTPAKKWKRPSDSMLVIGCLKSTVLQAQINCWLYISSLILLMENYVSCYVI